MNSPGISPGAERLFQEYLECRESGRDGDTAGLADRCEDAEVREQFLSLVETYVRVCDHLPEPGTEPLQIGPYQLDDVIGRGGMSVIYASRMPDGRQVAVKVLHEALMLHPAATRRFENEVACLEDLDHPHVVKVLDHGHDGHRMFLVMERMYGGTLQHRIEAMGDSGNEPGAEDVERFALVAEKIAEALASAHAHKVVHRDVKPSNILFDGDGEPHLADFGLARVTDATRITGTDQVMGTAPYAAPERITRMGTEDSSDPRLDVYSLGVTLFEMLAGFPPYQGPLAANQAARHHGPPSMNALPPAAREPVLEAILERSLEPRPERRYANARELADDLAARREGRPVRAMRGRRLRHTQLAIRSQPLTFAAVLVLLAVTLGLGAFQLVRSKRADDRVLELLREAEAHATDFRDFIDLLVPEPAPGAPRASNDWSDPSRSSSNAGLVTSAASLRLAAIGSFQAAEESLLQAMIGPRREEVHAALSGLWRARFDLAQFEGRATEARQAREHAERFGMGLESASLTVTTSPPDVTTFLSRYVPREGATWTREPVEGAQGRSGRLELQDLAPGSYLLELKRAGEQRIVRLPLLLFQGEDLRVDELWLPSDDEIGDGWIYVPPGRFLAGGDPVAPDPELPALRRIHEGFFIQETELTIADYMLFLSDLSRKKLRCMVDSSPVPGDTRKLPEGMSIHFPRDLSTESYDPELSQLVRDNEYFAPAAAVHNITPDDMLHYVAWRNAKAEAESRPEVVALPTGDQWEYAARGVDGRHFAWGDTFDWGCTAGGRSPEIDAMTMRPGKYAKDRSPFGLLDVCGNVREICLDLEEATGRYLVRGGEQSYYHPDQFRLAGRTGARKGEWNWNFGFRLVRKGPAAPVSTTEGE